MAEATLASQPQPSRSHVYAEQQDEPCILRQEDD